MDNRGSYSTHDYYREFGSWNEALDAADLDRRESLLTELERVAAEIGEIPSTIQIDEHSRYSSGMYANEFGTITAAREVADFSGVEDSEQSQANDSSEVQGSQSDDSTKESTENVGPSRKALIDEIQRLDDGGNLVPYASEMDSDGAYKAYDCLQEFGSWDDALEAAGIDKRARLLADLQRVRDELGRMPKTTDMKKYGRVSSSMYANFFGSWTKATSLIDAKEGQTTLESTTTDQSPESGDESNSSPVLSGGEENILTWEDIPRNSRLPSSIAIQVREKKRVRSNRVDGRYLVADLNGKEFELKVWQKHGLDIEWEIDIWYVLSEARGTVWESDDEVHRLLDSTRDLTAVKCGSESPIGMDS